MTTFLGIIIFLFVAAYGHKEYIQLKTGISPKGASNAARAALAGFIREKIAEKETVLDASSGWGGTLFSLSRDLPRHNISGVEFSFVPWLVCNFRSFAHRDTIANMNLLKTDIFKTDLRPFGVVFCNFPDAVLNKLAGKIKRELSSGSYLVSLNTPVRGWDAEKVISVSDPGKSKLYIYKGTAVARPAASATPGKTIITPKFGTAFPPVMVIGHRGFGKTSPYDDDTAMLTEERRMQIPENTYEACLKALQSGADGIEIDVIMSKDGEAVVCRDNDLNIHMTPDNLLRFGAMKISEQPYQTLRNLPIGFTGYKLATLDEILFLVIKYNAVLNIELKGKGTAAPVMHRIHSFVNEKHLNKDNIVISSFDHSQLKTVREIDAEIKTSMMFIPPDAELAPIYPNEPGSPYFQRFSAEYIGQIYEIVRPFAVHVPQDLVNSDLSAVIGKYSLNCFIYPLNEPFPTDNGDFISLMYHFKNGGAPIHIITNYPDIMMRFISPEKPNASGAEAAAAQ